MITNYFGIDKLNKFLIRMELEVNKELQTHFLLKVELITDY